MVIKITSEYKIIAESATVPAYNGNHAKFAIIRSRETHNGIEYSVHYAERDNDGEILYSLGVFSTSLYEASNHFKRRVDKIKNEIEVYHSWLFDILMERGVPNQGRDVRSGRINK